MGFWGGSSAKVKNVSTLTDEQKPVLTQLTDAAQRKGAGGAYGDAADYYRSNLSDNPADFNAFAAPAITQNNQDIIPGISEQFAGMGSGGMSSSGFRNAQIQGATDLSERLGALRAQLRQNSAQGLMNVGQQALGKYSENITIPGTEGFASSIAPIAGTVIGGLVGGPAGAAAGGAIGSAGKQAMSQSGWSI